MQHKNNKDIQFGIFDEKKFTVVRVNLMKLQYFVLYTTVVRSQYTYCYVHWQASKLLSVRSTTKSLKFIEFRLYEVSHKTVFGL